MRPFPVTRVWLKRALSFHGHPSSEKRTANVSERIPIVSINLEVCYSRRPSSAVSGPDIPCVFGLSPKFSTPVEKTVENRPHSRRRLDFWPECHRSRQFHESLGANPRPDRNKSEPAQLLHVVPANELHYRRPPVGHRARPQWAVQRLAHQALLGRAQRGDERGEAAKSHD